MDSRSGSDTGHVNFALDHTPSVASSSTNGPVELAPHIDHYRNVFSAQNLSSLKRPTLHDLHREIILVPGGPLGDEVDKQSIQDLPNGINVKKTTKHVKFGWIIGVLIRCTLNILGAMLYLRLTWITGQCGIGLSSLMVILSSVLTTLTTLSMCAICTNGEIRGGGAYFMLSRALGPEFGGSMGLIFSLANALAAALHTTGFSETVKDLMKVHSRDQKTIKQLCELQENGAQIVDGGTNDIRIISICTLCLLMAVVMFGVSVEVKAQIVLLLILIASYIVYVVGTFIPPTDISMAKGITGYSWQTLVDNFGPSFRSETFFSVFAVYFPAATGIMAGANISGDLKDPSAAIPKGTLLAILTTSLIYLSAIWMAGSTVIRDASGDVDDLQTGTVSVCAQNGPCPYGLMNYFQTMQMQSAFGPLIIAGIFAATLSSALVCLVSGPKLFQAVGRDKLFPKIDWFAKGYGRSDEPRRAYVLGFIISLAMACIGDLNTIAPFISNFYLATYALINFACFHGSIAKSPGWRPAFKYYNQWLSCLGALLCIAAMFMMSYIAAPLTFFFIAALYLYLSKRKPDVNWGSSNQAHQYIIALQSMNRLLRMEAHVKTYRPQILALTGNPASRPSMVDFVKGITHKNSLLIFGHILPRNEQEANWKTYEDLRRQSIDTYGWLKGRRVKGFYQPVTAPTTKDGLRILLQVGGLGKMRPNIVILGYKNRWNLCDVGEVRGYFELIHECFDADMAVCVLRVHQGLDYSSQMIECHVQGSETIKPVPSKMSIASKFLPAVYRRGSFDAVSEVSMGEDLKNTDSGSAYYDFSQCPSVTSKQIRREMAIVGQESQRARQVIQLMNQFRTKVEKGVVDVWWLCDDGGLALLIPHLLVSHKSYLRCSKLRIFTTSRNADMVNEQQKNMVALMAKFRISCTDVTVINSADRQPSQATKNEFEQLIEPLMHPSTCTSSDQLSPVLIDEDELVAMQDRTNHHLRIRELLKEHSENSTLIVITLPVPRKNGISTFLYLAWLEMLTSFTKSPVLLVRGNQQSVLTFYS